MIDSLEVNRRRLRRAAPSSMFTKRGPGVDANRLLWFQSLDSVDREYAIQFGWVPSSWRHVAPSRKFWRGNPYGVQVRPPVQETIADPAPQPSPGIVGRTVKKVWTGLKRIFGFRKGES